MKPANSIAAALVFVGAAIALLAFNVAMVGPSVLAIADAISISGGHIAAELGRGKP